MYSDQNRLKFYLFEANVLLQRLRSFLTGFCYGFCFFYSETIHTVCLMLDVMCMWQKDTKPTRVTLSCRYFFEMEIRVDVLINTAKVGAVKKMKMKKNTDHKITHRKVFCFLLNHVLLHGCVFFISLVLSWFWVGS